MDSAIRLFKAVPITAKGKKKAEKALLKETIEKGFVFSPEVIYNYSENELATLVRSIEKEVGLSGKQMNSSFHKSWKKVKDASIEQLVIEQIIHYFTTYGAEALGIYDKDSVYIPQEELKVPELKEGLTLIVIRGYTKPEFKKKLLGLLNQGIALKETTLKDVVDVALFTEINEEEIEQIKNREAKNLLYMYLGKIPENPVEFLRFLVYNSTNKTLLIKNDDAIKEIKSKDNLSVLRLFKEYEDKYGLEKLAQIFYRFKPLFLAFRTNTQLKHITNRIRKLAVKHHKPMQKDYLNEITAMIKKGEPIEGDRLKEELGRVNVFRKIRLAYALKYRTKNVDSILYKIRNGKGYATDFTFINKVEAKRIYHIVLNSIIADVKGKVKGKTVYIPENVVYTLPTAEKQFTGDIPNGSYISIPKDMVVGVHWDNVGANRIDLDLSLINANIGKIGWDARYRTEDREILFSGDMTDAMKPNGASELFYVKKQSADSFIMFVNYFNYEEAVKVPFKILVAKEQVKDFKQNYTVNPNNVLCIAKSEIDKQQKILGLLVTTADECKFYFSETNIGKSITSSGNAFAEKSRKYLFGFYQDAITLNEVLELAGAKIIGSREKADIDLSPENLERDKIIGLLTSK